MKEQFIPYEQVLELTELGFDEECFGFYELLNGHMFILHKHKFSDDYLRAPLWQQAFDWFEQFYMYSSINIEILGSDEWEYCYEITYLPKEFENLKRRTAHFVDINSCVIGPSSYYGAWSNKLDAQKECLKKLIELCKNK